MLCLASLLSSYSNAQTVDPTTGLLIYSTGNLTNFGSSATSTTTTWQNVGQYGGSLTCWQPGGPGYCGPLPYVNANGYGAINFSYGMTNLNQSVNVNNAVGPGSGIYVTGFNFSFTAKNGNGWDNGQQDYLTAYVKLNNTAGTTVENYNYNLNQKYNWTNFNFNETFNTPHVATSLSTAQYGFVGKDTNNWAGPYGPEINNVSFRLKYGVDPCSQNIAYSPSCPGYSSLVTSGNLLNPNYWSQNMNQAVNINQALQNAGIGATVYGVNYAFDWHVGGQQCTASFIICWAWGNSNLNVNVGLTSNNGSTLYSKSYSFSGENIGGTVANNFVLPTPLNQTALGAGYINSSGWGDSGIGNLRASLIYTADPCVADPLYSPLCKGYSLAYAKNMILGSTVALTTSPSGLALAQTGANQNTTIQQATASATTQQPAPAPVAPQPAPLPSSPAPQPQQDLASNPASNVAQPNPTQPGPQQAGAPTPSGGPQSAPTQQTATNSPLTANPVPAGKPILSPSSQAMAVVKSAQEKDKATQQLAVQNAAKVVEASTQQSQATASAAIAQLNDMSNNSAQTAAQFSSQTTQASIQSIQIVQTQQQLSQSISQQTSQSNKISQQIISTQDVQQTQVQNNTNATQQVQQTKQNQDIQQTQTQITTTTIQITAPVAQQQQQDTQSAAVAIVKPTVPIVAEISPQASSGTGITITRNPFAYNPFSVSMFNNISTTQQPSYQLNRETKQFEIDTQPAQVFNFSGFGRAGNPLSELIMQQRFELLQSSIEQRIETVNKNAQENELAGGVRLDAMATQPKGFEVYSVVLKDAAFYDPKEIYRNQQPVDNARALRQLASDRLHQMMIELQYKIGD